MATFTRSPRPVSLPHIPALYNTNYLDELLPPCSKHVQPSADLPDAPFMSALRQVSNRVRTQNNAAAYASTTSPTLDVFTDLSQATTPDKFESLLNLGWAHDPLTTLKLIWNLRSIHQGKSAREPFYRAFAWLYRYHPRTAIGNLEQLVIPTIEDNDPKRDPDLEKHDSSFSAPRGFSHGYFKDLLNILVLAVTGQLNSVAQFTSLHVPRLPRNLPERGHLGRAVASKQARKKYKKVLANTPTESAADRIQRSLQRDKESSDIARQARLDKNTSYHATLLSMLHSDSSFKGLYIAVAQIFSKYLTADLELLRKVDSDAVFKSEERFDLSYKMSLAGKWAPTVGGFHDCVTSISTAIALLLCHQGQLPQIAFHVEVDSAASQAFAHTIRDAYTRTVTTPLRRFTEIPEVHMSANEWGHIIYSRVPSICMNNTKQLFFKHDKERFAQYIGDVSSGKKRISGATLLPHKLLVQAIKLHRGTVGVKTEIHRIANEMEIQVLDQQWKSLVRSIKDTGVLENALAVCDVSGSMGVLGRSEDSPIHPAVALSLILAQVASPPWANSFITFSQSPEIIDLHPEAGLVANANTMATSNWSMNTDFSAVFLKLILPMAIQNNLKREDMIKRLFVFSDMEFDDSRVPRYSSSLVWETEHAIIKREFEQAGYDLPEIVYWNLKGTGSKPVPKDEEGVAMVSGYSSAMIKNFLDEGKIEVAEEEWEEVEEDGQTKTVRVASKKLDPIATMMKALDKPSYAGLRILD